MIYQLKKIELSKADKLYSFYQKIPAIECGFENNASGLSISDFREYIKKRIDSSNGINLKPGRVPSTEYIFYVDDIPVGLARLRHYLNEALLKRSGHIGFGISPEFRRRGYANVLLHELLIEAKQKGINKVLLTCNNQNIGSYKTIEKNGGVLEKIEDNERFYWITLS